MGRRYKKHYSRNYRSKRNYKAKHNNSPRSLKDMITEFLALLLGFLIMIAFLTKNGWFWVLLAVLVGCVPVVLNVRKYRKGAYYQNTKNSYLSILFDKGKYGEYLTYKYLKHLEAGGAKFLFNTYIPKGSEGTTEIDVLMICPKGIFVFESKNYSGWIFGSEQQLHWYQTLPSGRKSRKQEFYNPVMQNNTHIKFLKAMLGKDVPMHSVIVFSERCTLKNVQIQSKDIRVINRQQVKKTVTEICQCCQDILLDEKRIVDIYNELYPFTQVDQKTKTKHIENIQNIQSNKTSNAIQSDKPTPQEIADTEDSPNFIVLVETTEEVENMASAIEVGNAVEEIPIETMQPQYCPWCKGELVVRTVGKGANAGKRFYGCSNFPKCRYIKNISDDEMQ